MKNMKKFLAMMLALVMVLGMTVTASAAEVTANPTGKESDRGSITITNVDTRVGTSIKLYRVLKAEYDETTGAFTGYGFVSTDIGNILNAYQAEKKEDDAPDNYIEALKAGKAATLDADVIKALAGVKGTPVEDVTFSQEGNKTTDTDGTEVAAFKSSGVPVGMYLVEIDGTETRIYNHAVASVYYQENNALGNDALNLSISSPTIAAKVTKHPTVEKTAKDKDSNAANSVNVGDIITYEVTINPVPNYSGVNPVLDIVDTLSGNLKLQTKADGSWDVTVTPYKGEEAQTALTPVSDYVLDGTTDSSLKVNFVVGGEYKLGAYAGEKVVISYKVKLMDTAAGNEQDNYNDVTLNYTRDSKITGNEGKTTDTDKTHTYTFNVGGDVTGITGADGILTKIGDKNDEDSQGLPDAEFTIYTADPTGKTEEELAKITYKNDKHTNGVVTSDENGKIAIQGLAAGGEAVGTEKVYYLKETAAPEGYTLNSHVFVIKVGATYRTEADEHNEAGTLKSWMISIDGEATNKFAVDQGRVTLANGEGEANKIAGTTIQNTTMSVLPSTGGIGTTIFTIAGCAIMVLAAALFFVSRRKSSVK